MRGIANLSMAYFSWMEDEGGAGGGLRAGASVLG
jgi:hypothetical protein